MSDFDGNRVLIGMRRRSLFSTSAAATAAAATAAADASVRRTVLRGEPRVAALIPVNFQQLPNLLKRVDQSRLLG